MMYSILLDTILGFSIFVNGLFFYYLRPDLFRSLRESGNVLNALKFVLDIFPIRVPLGPRSYLCLGLLNREALGVVAVALRLCSGTTLQLANAGLNRSGHSITSRTSRPCRWPVLER